MPEKLPENLDKAKHQVFLYRSPGNLPFSFVPHYWFVINRLGTLTRWEVLFRKIKNKSNWGHLHKDFFLPFQGIEIFPYVEKYFLTGPNSNTYAQWILDNCPEFQVKLPWNAFGKSYHKL